MIGPFCSLTFLTRFDLRPPVTTGSPSLCNNAKWVSLLLITLDIVSCESGAMLPCNAVTIWPNVEKAPSASHDDEHANDTAAICNIRAADGY